MNKRPRYYEKNARTDESIHVNGKTLEDVQEFNYLGSKMMTDGDCMTEINSRISQAGQAF